MTLMTRFVLVVGKVIVYVRREVRKNSNGTSVIKRDN